MPQIEIKQGGVFLLPHVPDERGKNPMHRRVIVIHPPEVIDGAGEILVCAASTTTMSECRIRIPSTLDNPAIRTGFTEHTWAVPSWLVLAPPGALTDWRGYISKAILEAVVWSANDLLATRTANVYRLEL